MTEDELVDVLVHELRAMATAGKDVPSLLGRVQEMFGREDCKLLSVLCFRKAFDASIASISSIAGWRGFGGELSDAQVNSFVLPVLEDYNSRGAGSKLDQ